ncbi:O-antigen ligase family protein [Aromatoleum anaerobium]|uniref:O-antigen ligase domain-containing protein n=1 Tax=Aromatoleum anaerobium TaxID=182180 RepID=A0ABX1PLW2_9RHOO|nr:O-antigen ligase family protein [Aromatoleum anaerobium]MCK0505777.1 O-antigen ligase family protein [Aromatoleum anaerobium]
MNGLTMDGTGQRSAGWVAWVAGLMLVFAPLVRGANRPLALLALELLALLLLAGAVARPVFMERLSRPLLLALAMMVAVPLLQLAPLPFELGATLPGHGAYAVAQLEAGAAPEWLALSTVPYLTEQALWALLPPLAVFLVVVGLDEAQVRRLVMVFVAVAVFQAVMGLMQYGAGPESALRFGYESSGDSAIGTYANRGHLAGLLLMALPIGLALLASTIFSLDESASRRQRRGGALHRLKALVGGEGEMNRTAVYAAVCVALLLGIVFARSRSGIALGMVGVVLSAVVLMRNFGAGFATRMVGAVSALGVALAVAVGLAPVFARFAQDATADARWPILDATLEAALAFFPFGSGMGTFPAVIRAFHPAEIGGEAYINHAHNDFAEWWMEGGVPALVLMLTLAAIYLLRWRAVWAVRNWRPLHMMQVGAGLGVLLILLFGLTDYNLRIPANAMYFAFLAAVFFHPGERERVRRRGERRRPAAVAEPVAAQARAEPVVPPGTRAGEAGAGARRNPFAD